MEEKVKEQDSKLETEVVKEVDNKAEIEKTIKNLKQIQKERIIVNVGGQNFSFSLSMLKNTISENIFSSYLPNTDENAYFYDSNPELFNYVYEVISELNNSNKEKYTNNSQLVINIRHFEDEIVLKEIIKDVFPKSEEEILPFIKIEREVAPVENQRNHETQNQENVNANQNNYNDYNDARYDNYNRGNYSDYS